MAGKGNNAPNYGVGTGWAGTVPLVLSSPESLEAQTARANAGLPDLRRAFFEDERRFQAAVAKVLGKV